MLMTGADERGVAAIERLTKQKFEVSTLSGIERPRQRTERDRGERRGRGERSERGDRRPGPPPPQQPVDDFFSKPYQPSESEAVAEPSAPPAAEPVSRERRPAGRVSALLGGGKK